MADIKDEIAMLLDSSLTALEKDKAETEEEEEEKKDDEEEEVVEKDEEEEESEESSDEEENEPDPNEALLEKIAGLESKIKGLEKPEVEEKKEPEEIKLENIMVAKEGDFEDITESHESLNKFGNAVSQKTQENILKVLPSIVSNLVYKVVDLQTSAKEFWRNNEDLVAGKDKTTIKDVKGRLQILSNAIHSADPTKSYAEVFEEAGNIVRGNGRKPKFAKNKKVAKVKTPGSSKINKEGKKVKTISTQIDDLFN